jgi:DNA mismatch repair protein MutH
MPYLGSFRDLVQRIDQFVGIPFEELGELFGIPYTGSAVRNRGWAGNVVHAMLLEEPDNDSGPDLKAHGIEVKGLPIDKRGRVLEPTSVGAINYDEVARTDWWESKAFHKLRAILFVPIVKYETTRPQDFYARYPFLWFPTRADLAVFHSDYDSVRELVLRGEFGKISSALPPRGQGVALHPKPKHGEKSPTTLAHYRGKAFEVERRGWMLRESFTQPIMDRNLSEAHLRAKLDITSSR